MNTPSATDVFDRRLAWLAQADNVQTLQAMRRGIEKESLRVNIDGTMAQTRHPVGLGSALTHPLITTDFAEAQLEFITPPCSRIDEALAALDDIHRYTYSVLQRDHQEHLWTSSMPCVLGDDNQIPIAEYGISNAAQMKQIYRMGLSNRYGRPMQTISGVHYNVSFPDSFWERLAHAENSSKKLTMARTDFYFAMIRNFRRHFWLLVYLFGAAPAVCNTFVRGREHHLDSLGEHSLYLPGGTSLRMGDLGYYSRAQQSSLMACYNRLDSYVKSLLEGITTPHPEYARIGVCKEGEYQQLNTGLLQLENEFYSAIRPKQTPLPGEAPLHALAERGVQYIEVRCVDLNPFSPIGIDKEQAAFIEVFLMLCLLQESPPCDLREYREIQHNQTAVVERGRDQATSISLFDESAPLHERAASLLARMTEVATVMDKANTGNDYAAAVHAQLEKPQHPELTPSARIIDEIHNCGSFFRQAHNASLAHQQYFLNRPLTSDKLAHFEQLAHESLQRQTTIERADQLSFAAYLQKHYAQYGELNNLLARQLQ